jgi:hemerythrin-like domain-containing protein
MKATKILRTEQEMIDRFLAAFGLGATSAAQNRPVKPGFFIYGSNFIKGYIERSYFKKEETLLKCMENNGVPVDHGPLAQMFKEIKQSRELSEDILSGARQWQTGDIDGRNNVIWATSTYTSMMRQHLDRSRNIIFQLAEQVISPDDEHWIAEEFNHIVFKDDEIQPVEHYEKIIKALEDDAQEWKR